MLRKQLLSFAVLALASLIGVRALASVVSTERVLKGDGDSETTVADPPISISSSF